MELLKGATLKHRIDGRPLRMDTLVEIGIDVADALDAAHARNHPSRHQAREYFHNRARPSRRFWISVWRSSSSTGRKVGETISMGATATNVQRCCWERIRI